MQIRKTPELTSVEVTFTALEQTLKMEMVRQNYSRLVIDSLTALQYFCMKGYDETLGAQTFLRLHLAHHLDRLGRQLHVRQRRTIHWLSRRCLLAMPMLMFTLMPVPVMLDIKSFSHFR